MASLKNDLRTVKMKKEDNVSSFFVKIERMGDELLSIDEIVLDK